MSSMTVIIQDDNSVSISRFNNCEMVERAYDYSNYDMFGNSDSRFSQRRLETVSFTAVRPVPDSQGIVQVDLRHKTNTRLQQEHIISTALSQIPDSELLDSAEKLFERFTSLGYQLTPIQ